MSNNMTRSLRIRLSDLPCSAGACLGPLGVLTLAYHDHCNFFLKILSCDLACLFSVLPSLFSFFLLWKSDLSVPLFLCSCVPLYFCKQLVAIVTFFSVLAACCVCRFSTVSNEGIHYTTKWPGGDSRSLEACHSQRSTTVWRGGDRQHACERETPSPTRNQRRRDHRNTGKAASNRSIHRAIVCCFLSLNFTQRPYFSP